MIGMEGGFDRGVEDVSSMVGVDGRRRREGLAERLAEAPWKHSGGRGGGRAVVAERTRERTSGVGTGIGSIGKRKNGIGTTFAVSRSSPYGGECELFFWLKMPHLFEKRLPGC